MTGVNLLLVFVVLGGLAVCVLAAVPWLDRWVIPWVDGSDELP